MTIRGCGLLKGKESKMLNGEYKLTLECPEVDFKTGLRFTVTDRQQGMGALSRALHAIFMLELERKHTEQLEVKTTVENCARCGGTHMDIVFKRITTPCRDMTHWVLCPVTEEPIMLRIVQTEEENKHLTDTKEETTPAYLLRDIIQRLVDHMRHPTSNKQGQLAQKMYSRQGYLREMRTIRVAGGRRWGHTTAALHAVGLGSTLYISFCQDSHSLARATLDRLSPNKTSVVTMATMQTLPQVIGHRFDCILVDSAAVILKTEAAQDELYSRAETLLNPDGFLLLVG